ncbi:UNVERIFIED_CONTAM: Retrovirus-related Pol polyprotein from transposon RE2 [Sesamum indicum]
MIVSRDVILNENVFPFANQPTDPISCSLPNILSDNDIDYQQETDIMETNTDINTNEIQENEADQLPVPRRSNRYSNRPIRFNDYICTHVQTKTDIHAVLHSPYQHKSLLTAAKNPAEPTNFNEAIKTKKRVDAMNNEIKALEDNQTWEITVPPKEKRAIGCKWVYKLKVKQDGTVDRYKARLVAKRYNQVEGVDYLDSFSPMAKAVTIRTLLAIVAKYHWHLHQLDINNAFLHEFLDEEIYMLPPEGYSVPKDHVCKLKKSLSKTGIVISQTKYIKDIIDDVGLSEVKATSTPLLMGIKLSSSQEEQLENPESFRRLLGRLLYLGFTRPDICHGTQQLSQYMQFPCKANWNAALHLVRYIKTTMNRGLQLNTNDSFELKAFCDGLGKLQGLKEITH